MPTKPTDPNDLDKNLKELSQIAEWFDDQDEVNVEEGLKKVKRASELIRTSKKRLEQVENEFEEIKKEVSEDIPIEGDD